jgi:hypothetical protein
MFLLESRTVTTKTAATDGTTTAAATATTTSLAEGCSHRSVHIQKKIPI